ncbi:hypothetical protein QFZ81_007022 [Paenibacillus sp. V4I9]|nr:hypothetical protein [Paenibacillus sp. V4I9]
MREIVDARAYGVQQLRKGRRAIVVTNVAVSTTIHTSKGYFSR